MQELGLQKCKNLLTNRGKFVEVVYNEIEVNYEELKVKNEIDFVITNSFSTFNSQRLLPVIAAE